MECDFFDSRKNVCTINDKPCCLQANAPVSATKECSSERINGLINVLKPRRAQKLAARFSSIIAAFQTS